MDLKKSIIHVERLNKNFILNGQAYSILKDINFTINQGEIVSVIGPSGSGKSTLLSILGTLDKPSEGEVTLSGNSIINCKERELEQIRAHSIGFVFQNYNLISTMTAKENIFTALMAAGIKRRKELNQRAEKLLNAVGISEQADKLPSQMSGGQQQRVALARALANNPKIVFADEPTGNLDATASQNIMNLIHSLREQFGTTFVIVTHDPRIASQSDRVLRIDDGQVTDADAEELAVSGS
ncbi:Lipoprotein-releasing system ATP-binding protein LolD [compost metagenome]